MDKPVCTRCCLTSDASLSVEAARVAMANWLTARRHSGRFLLRIAASVAAAAEANEPPALDDLRWLELDWDEVVPRPRDQAEPYNDYYDILVQRGAAYFTFDTPEELERMRQEALAAWRVFRYPRPGRFATDAEVRQAQQQGRPVVLRLKMPGCDITIQDRVLGPVTIPAAELDDPVIRQPDGQPTWWFAEVIEDELAGVTQVIRGQETLPWAHRQAALQEALGFDPPTYAHLPLILGEDGQPLPREVDVRSLRAAGYLPEVVAEFLVRLGWEGPAGRLSRQQWVRQYDVTQVSRTAPRLRWHDLLASNAAAMAKVGEPRLIAGLRDCLAMRDTPVHATDDETLRKLVQLVPEAQTFGQIEQKCRALFVEDEQVVYDERAVSRVLARGKPSGAAMVAIAGQRLAGLATWQADAIERTIVETARQAALKPARLMRAIRVAVMGRTDHLSVGRMLEVLGRERTLRRMQRTADNVTV